MLERQRREAEKEEEQHLVMQIVVQSFVSERPQRASHSNICAYASKRISGQPDRIHVGSSTTSSNYYNDMHQYFNDEDDKENDSASEKAN